MKKLFLCLLLVSPMMWMSCATGEASNAAKNAGGNVGEKVGEKAKKELIDAEVISNPKSAEPGERMAKLPVMTFEKDLHNFGNIVQGEKVEYNFKFTNTGGSPLVISSAKGSCGCTVPSYPEEPVQVGESAYMTVTFDSEGRKDKFTKEVSISANTDPNINRLVIEGQITVPQN